jgi:hypothetical protein
MSDIITAKEFIVNTFDASFLTSSELETIITAMELFAKGKCKEQRQICFDAWQGMPEWDNDPVPERIERSERTILNANEPQF